MELFCNNCRYVNLNYDAIPCRDCRDKNRWRKQVENMNDPLEIAQAVLETQIYILEEIGQIRDKLDKIEPRGADY